MAIDVLVVTDVNWNSMEKKNNVTPYAEGTILNGIKRDTTDYHDNINMIQAL